MRKVFDPLAGPDRSETHEIVNGRWRPKSMAPHYTRDQWLDHGGLVRNWLRVNRTAYIKNDHGFMDAFIVHYIRMDTGLSAHYEFMAGVLGVGDDGAFINRKIELRRFTADDLSPGLSNSVTVELPASLCVPARKFNPDIRQDMACILETVVSGVCAWVRLNPAKSRDDFFLSAMTNQGLAKALSSVYGLDEIYGLYGLKNGPEDKVSSYTESRLRSGLMLALFRNYRRFLHSLSPERKKVLSVCYKRKEFTLCHADSPLSWALNGRDQEIIYKRAQAIEAAGCLALNVPDVVDAGKPLLRALSDQKSMPVADIRRLSRVIRSSALFMSKDEPVYRFYESYRGLPGHLKPRTVRELFLLKSAQDAVHDVTLGGTKDIPLRLLARDGVWPGFVIQTYRKGLSPKPGSLASLNHFLKYLRDEFLASYMDTGLNNVLNNICDQPIRYLAAAATQWSRETSEWAKVEHSLKRQGETESERKVRQTRRHLDWRDLGRAEIKGVRIICCANRQTLIHEGAEMEHCVALYASKCECGGDFILSLDDGVNRSTAHIALRHNQDGDRYQMAVLEHRSHANAAPLKIHCQALSEYADAINQDDRLLEIIVKEYDCYRPLMTRNRNGPVRYDVSAPDTARILFDRYKGIFRSRRFRNMTLDKFRRWLGQFAES